MYHGDGEFDAIVTGREAGDAKNRVSTANGDKYGQDNGSQQIFVDLKNRFLIDFERSDHVIGTHDRHKAGVGRREESRLYSE